MPLSLPEILETVRMTEADAFDIRTVTLGISLRGCASRDPESTRQNIYDRITQTARHHVEVAREVESLYGVAIANKRCSITPASLVWQTSRTPKARSVPSHFGQGTASS